MLGRLRRRRVVAAFRGEANLRKALRELSALGVSSADVTRVAEPVTLRSPDLAGCGGWSEARSARFERALASGATLLLIPVDEAGAEKQISLAMLRHSEGPVEVQDEFEAPEKRNEDRMKLKRIRLELARNPGFPEGSATHGYEFSAPLTADGHIDAEAWRSPEVRSKCRVRRFWDGEDDQEGELIHTRKRQWAFSYAPGEEDDEAFAKLDRHLLREGEYLTIREPDGRAFTFRIAGIDG